MVHYTDKTLDFCGCYRVDAQRSVSHDNVCYVPGLVISSVWMSWEIFWYQHTLWCLFLSVHVTFYTIHWAMLNPDTADEICVCHYVILNKKRALFNIVCVVVEHENEFPQVIDHQQICSN